jgi:hypothetical protein
VYYFNSTAFVDTSRLGVYEYTSGGKSEGSNTPEVKRQFCVAPIVDSFTQRSLVYWALARDWYG